MSDERENAERLAPVKPVAFRLSPLLAATSPMRNPLRAMPPTLNPVP